jgi:hypothetical protein
MIESSDEGPPPLPVFFPPEPPPLDLATSRAASSRYGGLRAASSELSAYVCEPFYSVLAARLDRDELSSARRDSLHRYHDEKSLLQHNLRTELAYILQQPPAARDQLLAALARQQDPAIHALEQRAEDIRSDLFKSSYAWDAARKPPITDTAKPSNQPDDVARVMLGAAFFQHGLSAPQRTLLREIAIEVTSAGPSVAAATAAQPYVFFSPGPSRVRFPPDLSDAVAAKLAAFQTRKSALRKELYDTIYREDATWWGMVRTSRFRSLAEKQAPEFAALETLAEEIRRELPPPPAPRPPQPLVALPPALVDRIDALLQRQSSDQRVLNAPFEQLRASDSLLFMLTVFNPETGRYELKRRSRIYAGSAKASERVNAHIETLLAAYDQLDAALTTERNAICRDVTAQLHTEDPARINLALADGVRVVLEQRNATGLRDYQQAVFEPGLSPAQRRLLFDHALEELDLPLPGGIWQPRERLEQPTASNQR